MTPKIIIKRNDDENNETNKTNATDNNTPTFTISDSL